MLMGQYDYAVDAKGRLNFPAKFRDEMGDSFVVTRWLDGCLVAFPKNAWDKVFTTLSQAGLADAYKLRRMLLASAAEVTPDKQGRILIPPSLRRHAGLEKDVTIVGTDPYVEIWDTDRWNQTLEADMDSAAVAAAMQAMKL